MGGDGNDGISSGAGDDGQQKNQKNALKPGFHHHLSDRHAKCVSNLTHIQQGDIIIPSLYCSHVAAINMSRVSQGFLRPTTFLPQFAHGLTEHY